MTVTYLPGDQKLDYAQIKQLWLSEGGAPALADTMAAIGLAESGGHTGVVNDNPATGDYSVGIWQINYFGDLLLGRSHEYGTPAALAASPTAQAHAAISLAGDGSGLRNWSTYTSGAYKSNLAPGTAPATGAIGGASNVSVLSDLGGALGHLPGFGWLFGGSGVSGSLASLATLTAVAVKAAAWIADPHNWVRIGEVGAGIVAVFLGLKLLAATDTGPIATIAALPGKAASSAAGAVHKVTDTAAVAAVA